MGAPSAAQIEPTIVIVAILLLLVARRTYASISGAAYSPARLFAFVGFAALFFALFAGSTIYAALGTWGSVAWLLLAPYLLVPAVVVGVTIPHVRAAVRFERRDNGQTYFRLPWLVPVLYLVLFTSRLAIEIVLFGLSSLFSPSFPSSLPTGTLLVTIAFDLLYAVSVGLLLGRGVGVRQAFERSAAPATPPPANPPLA